jgi:hypothetical protein
VAATTIELLRPYKDLVLTITADREKEFTHHEKVAKAQDCDYKVEGGLLIDNQTINNKNRRVW